MAFAKHLQHDSRNRQFVNIGKAICIALIMVVLKSFFTTPQFWIDRTFWSGHKSRNTSSHLQNPAPGVGASTAEDTTALSSTQLEQNRETQSIADHKTISPRSLNKRQNFLEHLRENVHGSQGLKEQNLVTILEPEGDNHVFLQSLKQGFMNQTTETVVEPVENHVFLQTLKQGVMNQTTATLVGPVENRVFLQSLKQGVMNQTTATVVEPVANRVFLQELKQGVMSQTTATVEEPVVESRVFLQELKQGNIADIPRRYHDENLQNSYNFEQIKFS
ncbi:hypothetical protein DFH28DRAFT_957414 [Melampsora americana]|nr:hypothetical protein DFH28DRAFT_957414 [Melampsora americana]